GGAGRHLAQSLGDDRSACNAAALLLNRERLPLVLRDLRLVPEGGELVRPAPHAVVRAGAADAGADAHTGTGRCTLQVAHHHVVELGCPAVADRLEDTLYGLFRTLTERVQQSRLREVRALLEVLRRLVESLVRLLRGERSSLLALQNQHLHAGARPHRRLARGENGEG